MEIVLRVVAIKKHNNKTGFLECGIESVDYSVRGPMEYTVNDITYHLDDSCFKLKTSDSYDILVKAKNNIDADILVTQLMLEGFADLSKCNIVINPTKSIDRMEEYFSGGKRNESCNKI